MCTNVSSQEVEPSFSHNKLLSNDFQWYRLLLLISSIYSLSSQSTPIAIIYPFPNMNTSSNVSNVPTVMSCGTWVQFLKLFQDEEVFMASLFNPFPWKCFTFLSPWCPLRSCRDWLLWCQRKLKNVDHQLHTISWIPLRPLCSNCCNNCKISGSAPLFSNLSVR